MQVIYQNEHGLTFPLFEKTDVRGPSSLPLFQYLTQQAPFQGFDPQTKEGRFMDSFLRDKHPEIYADDGIKWNFSKFLIDRDGHVRGRFEVTTELSAIEAVIQSLL
ncbi:glutathione peroxidase-family protein [Paenibacillus brasilensis]|uniref:Glutathione peroxidase homolog BsaA n=2 Tax=Paenibacillus brasilensis TaxID=128574 RepID=A0ABU0KSK3_9BACL|nr:glutathione peroxidase-family protein [Paenibacillus brasilensis]